MAARGATFRKPSVIPGFGLTLGFTVVYLSLLVLIPLAALVLKTTELSWAQFWAIAVDRRTLDALKLSFGASFIAALVNGVFGLIIAWVLVRYRFPGRRLFDAFIDLPFALPTAVAGLALSTLYAPNGWLGGLFTTNGVIGSFLNDIGLAEGSVRIAYTQGGIVIALIFIGLPFVVRTLQPVIEEFDREVEEAAATLGAKRGRTVFRVLLPMLVPAWLTGFSLAFARAVGEYGSVIFIAGNFPYITEIAPQLIYIKLAEFDYAGATAVACIMLALSFTLLLVVNLLQGWSRRRLGHG